MLEKKIKAYRLLLGSQSPRRRFLLKELGLHFQVLANRNIDESYPNELKMKDIPVYLSEKKANSYMSAVHEDDILITADTIVSLNNHVVGKPVDKADAIRMLHDLSGNMHTVITGVCMAKKEKRKSFSSFTDVYFRRLSTEEIEFYVSHYKPFDKAGGYGIQEWIGYIGVEKIVGSFHNVMGLPIQKLYIELDAFLGN